MKKLKLFVFGVTSLAMLLISCGQKRNELVDTWKIINVEAKTPHSDSIKNDILTNGTLTFTKDGHVTGFLENEINDGTYALTKQGKSLVIKDETGTPYAYESTITDNQLVLDSKEIKFTLNKK